MDFTFWETMDGTESGFCLRMKPVTLAGKPVGLCGISFELVTPRKLLKMIDEVKKCGLVYLLLDDSPDVWLVADLANTEKLRSRNSAALSLSWSSGRGAATLVTPLPVKLERLETLPGM